MTDSRVTVQRFRLMAFHSIITTVTAHALPCHAMPCHTYMHMLFAPFLF